jgi:hypothetical protein
MTGGRVLVNDQREHPSSSPPVYVRVSRSVVTYVTGIILVNDQREHPSSSPPLYVRASRKLNLCNRHVRPGNSTYVTDVILVNDQREHPSSSPPLYVRACVRPDYSTYVT